MGFTGSCNEVKPIFNFKKKVMLSPKEIEALKKKYGTIHLISIDVSDKEEGEERTEKDYKCAYLKTPSRKVLKMANAVAAKDPLGFAEIILNNCWVGGDEEIKTEDPLFLAASGMMGELIEVKEATIKKL